MKLANSNKYSLIILSWKRSVNFKTILDEYCSNPQVDEIIISQGHKDFQVKYNHPKVVIINDTQLNQAYGLNLRFLNGLSARNNSIIYTDDDVLVKKTAFKKTIDEYEKNPKRIVGAIGRPLDGYKNFKHEQGNGIILTKFLITNKELLRLYFVLFPFFYDLFKTGLPFGNGEDILLSLISRAFYRQENIAVGSWSDLQPLDTHGVGCDTWKGHYQYRAKIYDYWMNHKSLIESVIMNYKIGLK